MTDILKRWAVATLVLLTLVLGISTYRGIQQRAVLAERLKIADKQHVQDSLASLKAVAIAQVATQTADSLRKLARIEVAKDRALQVKTDSQLRASANERDEARRLLADSGATVVQLRGVVADLLTSAQADSVAFGAERQSATRTIASLTRALTQDSTTQASQTDAINAAIKRAVSAENQVALLRKSQPSTFGNVVRGVALVGATVLAVKLAR